MKVEPIVDALEAIATVAPEAHRVLLSPRGRALDHRKVMALSAVENLVLVCGRYEGVDERVRDFVDEELSIGDYVLSGGEPAALVVIDAVVRQIPGALGNLASAASESFVDDQLEYPQYTRPEIFRDRAVPPVLLSGDHAAVEAWRTAAARELTARTRPDLAARGTARSDDMAPLYLALLHFPVYDKNRQVVTTAVTHMDIHDIARSACTFGVRRFYVVTPVHALRELSARILEHWGSGWGASYNATRKDALALVGLTEDLDHTIVDVERDAGVAPMLLVTSARTHRPTITYAGLRRLIAETERPLLIVFGTGWGLTEEIIDRADHQLPAVLGTGDYNHLSVRSAAAIILDRMCGRQEDIQEAHP